MRGTCRFTGSFAQCMDKDCNLQAIGSKTCEGAERWLQPESVSMFLSHYAESIPDSEWFSPGLTSSARIFG